MAGVDHVQVVGCLVDRYAEGAHVLIGRQERSVRSCQPRQLAVGGRHGVSEAADQPAFLVELEDDGVGAVGDVDVAAAVVDGRRDMAPAE
jgi:hypothetical protein